MKALLFRDHGGPEAMTIADAPPPAPGADDVLVEVHAASLNPIDWKLRAGLLRGVFEVALPRTLGRDFSGTVVEAGENVTDLRPGQTVFGAGQPQRDGSHAELVAVDAGFVAPKPRTLGHPEAASLVISGLTALAALEDVAPVEAGQRVLVHAGAGGVGSLAVQLARARGAEVIATASATNHDFVRALGAHAVVDYRTQPFEDAAPDCDTVFDTLGGEVHRRSHACLKPGGTLVYVHAAPIPDDRPRDDIRVVNAPVQVNRIQLERLAARVAEGAMRPAVESRFPFARAHDAYALLETGHARGKIVLEMR